MVCPGCPVLPSNQSHLRLRDGGDELDDAVGDGLLELEAALFPQEGGQEPHQHAVLERVLEAQLHKHAAGIETSINVKKNVKDCL